MIVQGLLFLITGIASKTTAATECYSCVNASRIPDCTAIVTCSPGSSCFSECATFQGKCLYTMGCKSTTSCPVSSNVTSGSLSIVGRSTSGQVNCFECCSTSNCNRQLCQSKDSTCADKQGYDCEGIGASLNMCDDVSHSKINCRRFCGYCDTIDGGWSSWSEWSACDVTCGSGVRTKSRTCSAPAPQNGGSDCFGGTKLYENCTQDICPINGGWSSWTAWGMCSSTCDIGLQRRDRMCSQPYPAHNGEHCFGDSRDDRICLPGACADGVWSTWGSWGVCTKSCGGGVKSRTRGCNKPAPSMTGRYCSGEPTQTESCNTLQCIGQWVGFTVAHPITSPTSDQPTFYTVITNVGGGFNVATGVFTCSISGYYFFSVSLEKKSTPTAIHAYCYISKNNARLVFAYTAPDAAAKNGYYATGNSVYVHLNPRDTVALTGCSSISFLDADSSFSGFLVAPDAA